MAKRRTPPLFEVLSAPDRRPGPGGMLGRTPVQVQVSPPPRPPSPTSAPESTPGMGPPRVGPRTGVRNLTSIVSLGVAGFLIIVLGVWFFAFHQGQDHKQKELEPYLGDTSRIPAGSAPLPANPLNSRDSTPGAGPHHRTTSSPEPPPPALPVGDPRQPGINYLHIVTLNWKDAEKAAAYLTRSGVSAAAVPAKKGIDLDTARSKNLPLLVVATDGVPSGQFSSSAAMRSQLVEKVRKIGKRWQSEEKGPSDFGEPGWALFK